jgi:hypothetical protein
MPALADLFDLFDFNQQSSGWSGHMSVLQGRRSLDHM